MTDPYFIREFNMNVVSWTEAFLSYDRSVRNQNHIKFNPPGFFVSHEGHDIEKAKNVMNELECNHAHLYFNITTKTKTYGRHKDTVDVWFWQCQGATKWILDDKHLGGNWTDEVILNPGDLIFIPKNMYHNVIPLSPRLGISMSKR